jgi:SOS-response transcriptional repressor LexA
LRKGKTVTPAQKEIFLVIDAFWKKFGFAPSIDDIMSITGDKGRGNVARKMKALISHGLCHGQKGRARSIRPKGIRGGQIE